MIKFWCWSAAGCGSGISFSLSLTLGDGHCIQYMHTHQRVTLQQPWQRLHSVSTLVLSSMQFMLRSLTATVCYTCVHLLCVHMCMSTVYTCVYIIYTVCTPSVCTPNVCTCVHLLCVHLCTSTVCTPVYIYCVCSCVHPLCVQQCIPTVCTSVCNICCGVYIGRIWQWALLTVILTRPSETHWLLSLARYMSWLFTVSHKNLVFCTLLFDYYVPLPPRGHSWDKMLVLWKGNVNRTVSVLQYCVAYCYNGAQRYERIVSRRCTI